MKKKLLQLLLLFASLGSFAQTNPANLIRTDLIPPSPTAAGLARYGEIPINLATGSVGFSIPIFNASGSELSVPISLNYSYDGFRPGQPIGWVGMGWNLTAGGVITRTINDKLDNTMPSGGNYDDSYTNGNITTAPVNQTFLKNAALLYDTQQDVYNFSFGGFSGKFVEFNGTFHCLPHQKIKISGGGSTFTITTEDGTKYHFADKETTRQKGSPGAPYNVPNHTSSWYLSTITNVAGTEVVKFVYETDATYTRLGAAVQTYKKFETFYHGEVSTLSTINRNYPTYVDAIRLERIVTQKHTVFFNRLSSNREDLLDAARPLGSISVTDNTTGLTIKSFTFNYGYFSGSPDNHLYKYLKLKSVAENPVFTVGDVVDTTRKQVHVFDYENEGDTFPNKSDAIVDKSGYYTGGGSFGFILFPSSIYSGGPNRDPNYVGTIMGALKKITYPTGGSTTFTYGMNKTGGGGSPQPDVEFMTRTVLVSRPGGAGISNMGATKYFTINYTQNVTFNVIRTPKSPFADNNTRNTVADVEIGSGGTMVASILTMLESDNGSKAYTYSLPPGQYFVSAAIDSKENGMSVEFTYGNQRPGTSVNQGINAPGLRIEHVANSSLSGPISEKTYRYANGSFSDNGYDVKPFRQITVDPVGCDIYETNALVYSSYVSEGFNTNISNFYGTVYEDLIDGDGKLTTRNDFISFADTHNGIVPSAVTKYRNTATGLKPISRSSYVYQVMDIGPAFVNIRAYQTMEAINNTGFCPYGGPTEEFAYESSIFLSSIKFLKSTIETTYEGTDSLSVSTSHSYDIADATYNLMMSRTTGSDGSQTISKYKYPENYTSAISGSFVSANVLQPAWESQVWKKTGTDSVLVSAGLTQYSATKFKPVKQYLIAANGITAMNSEGKTGNKYSSLLSDTRYELRASYAYDTTGRTISQQLTGGIPTSYQWGYAANTDYHPLVLGQKNYPVAEARNALPSEFYTENFEEYSGAVTGTAHSGTKFFTDDFPVSWTAPNSREYVVDYWCRVGGKWTYRQEPYTGPTTLTWGDAIDDVRIHPKDALLNTYVYGRSGVTAQTDAKGLTSFFEYDYFNRLLNVKDQNGDIVKNYRFNYGLNSGALATGPFYNKAATVSVKKNNCAPGLYGSSVAYTIPANAYYSANSQAEADALATAAANSGAQANANANGTCISPIAFTYTNDTFGGGKIYQVIFRDTNGNILYTFSESQVIAGFSIAQGTYNVSFTIIDNATSFNGWGACILSSTSDSRTINYDDTTNSYSLNNVVLTAGTATINLTGLILID